MPTPALSDTLAREALAAVNKHGGFAAAAREMGIHVKTLESRVKVAKTRGFDVGNSHLETDSLIFPDLPSSELPAEQLIEQACKRFEGHRTAREARRWMEI
jgi:hypothetical protein